MKQKQERKDEQGWKKSKKKNEKKSKDQKTARNKAIKAPNDET